MPDAPSVTAAENGPPAGFESWQAYVESNMGEPGYQPLEDPAFNPEAYAEERMQDPHYDMFNDPILKPSSAGNETPGQNTTLFGVEITPDGQPLNLPDVGPATEDLPPSARTPEQAAAGGDDAMIPDFLKDEETVQPGMRGTAADEYGIDGGLGERGTISPHCNACASGARQFIEGREVTPRPDGPVIEQPPLFPQQHGPGFPSGP